MGCIANELQTFKPPRLTLSSQNETLGLIDEVVGRGGDTRAALTLDVLDGALRSLGHALAELEKPGWRSYTNANSRNTTYLATLCSDLARGWNEQGIRANFDGTVD